MDKINIWSHYVVSIDTGYKVKMNLMTVMNHVYLEQNSIFILDVQIPC